MIEESQSRRSFIRGAFILGGAALFTKILSAVYKVPYQNITGDEGMYVYQQVYPLYSVLLILATAGFPAAISKMVSEKWFNGQFEGARQIFRISIIILFLLGLVFFLLLFFGAGQLAEWMGNRNLLTLPIQTVSFALLIVPFLAVMRGFFQGQQNMVPTATSQIIEQMIRVATILAFAWYFMDAGLGIVYAGAGAVFGATTGAVGAFFVLLFYWHKNQLNQGSVQNPAASSGMEPPQKVIKTIFRLSLPICIGSLILPVFSLVDSFTVANFMVDLGWEMESAIRLKGVYDRGQPLIQVATFFATAIALSIVPAISEAKAKGKENELENQSCLALQLTWAMGLPASVGLAVIAEPANVMLFEDQAGSDALSILALTGIFSTLSIVTAGILQGLGKVYLPAIYLLIGVVMKTGLNALLIPVWDIRGAAAATVIAFACTALLQFLKLRQLFQWKTWFHRKTLLTGWSIIWMGFAVYGVSYGVQRLMLPVMEFRLAMMITTLISILTGIIGYLWALLRFGAWTRADLEKVPKLRRKLVPLLDKWGWLPDRRE